MPTPRRHAAALWLAVTSVAVWVKTVVAIIFGMSIVLLLLALRWWRRLCPAFHK